MPPILLHIYGPLAIHSFGLMIVIGVLITLHLLHNDTKLQKLISENQLITLFQLSFIAAIVGGRIWFLITNPYVVEYWTDCFAVWSGGLSVLGAFIATLITLTGYLLCIRLPILSILDRIALYAPLTQSISRLGCFFAGCCYGQVTCQPWAIMYTDPNSLAPLHVMLHPTQLYSSIFLAINFIVLYSFSKIAKDQKPGQILTLYVMLMSLERFVVDFFRGDREFFHESNFFYNFSIQQFLAFCLFCAALFFMIIIYWTTKKNESI